MGIPVPRIQHLAFRDRVRARRGLAGVFVGMYTSNVSPTSGAAAGAERAFVGSHARGAWGRWSGAVLGGFLALGISWRRLGISLWGDGRAWT